MAKQLVNPLERHVEKAILGLAGLTLIGSIATYVVRTPNRTELGGEVVTPSTVDDKIAAKATEAVSRMRNAKAEPKIPEPLAGKFAESLKPLKAPAFPLVAALRPDVPLVDALIGGGGPAGLVKVLKPAKPIVTKGRGTFVVQESAGTRLIPSDWVSASAVWSVKEQREAQVREYGSVNADLVLASPQLQRRAQLPDGTWSEGDWQDVDCTPAAKLPREPAITMISDGKKITVDRDVLKEIEKFRAELAHPNTQLNLLRPQPPEMAKPTHWTLPVLTSYRDVLMQDDEYLYPAEAPAVEPADRYGVGGEVTRKAAAKELNPAGEQAKRLDEARLLLDAALKNLVKSDATRAYNIALEVSVNLATSPADKEKAKKLMKDAEQAISDIARKTVLGVPGQPGGPGAAQAGQPKREKLPAQQVWAHDAKIGSLAGGTTYQYRLRFRLLNVLAGAPHKFDKPENAAVLLITGEWSDPSDPVTIANSVEYFVTGEDPKDKEISLDFFRWYLGVWLKPERRIKVGIGQTISDRQRVKAPGIDDPDVVETPEVDFTADAIVVDVDLDRPVRERKAGSTPKGVRFGAPAPATAAVVMDSQGRLTERFVLVDKNHPNKKEATGRLWTPKK